MVDTEDIKVWKQPDGTYEKWYYLSNGCICKYKISEQEYNIQVLVYN